MGVFRAESSDVSHMGVYTGMGVVLVWALLRANTVYGSPNMSNTASRTIEIDVVRLDEDKLNL